MSNSPNNRLQPRIGAAMLLMIAMTGGMRDGHAQPAVNRQKVRTVHTPAEFQRLTKGRVKLLRAAPPSELRRLQTTMTSAVMPWDQVTVIAHAGPGTVWIGTKRGAIRFSIGTGAREYFAGGRWLPADMVSGLGVEGDGSIVWIETPAGYSRIEYKRMTLAEKARIFVDRIRARHVRWGMTADSHLRTPGDLATNQMVSSDNDGLWTQMYIAAEAFRYRVTGERDAAENARQGLQAMLRLEEITGIPGFHARSIIKVGADPQPDDGEWHTTADGGWRWKGDTSSDEIVGHYFGYSVYHDLAADEDEKRRIAAVVDRMTDHIIDHGYHLVDVDGKPTRWGWWAPEEIWEDPDETGLRALHLLSHLRVAMHLTQSAPRREKYLRHYRELIDRHRYHQLTRNQKINIPGSINHSDDELAFLSYYPLMIYETDPTLREVYLQGLDRSWQVERPERNPLWNFIYAAGSGDPEFDREDSLRTLREIPMDLIAWTVNNSSRLDVPMDALADRFKRKQALIVLPYDELPMSKWNGNPYRVDGGNGGRSEDDGVCFLLPYWMGRHHKLIGE
ncbi:MAG: hypothetical protein ACKVX9_12790 [Blastocatellia bacterium]